jgi:hypothetical protein
MVLPYPVVFQIGNFATILPNLLSIVVLFDGSVITNHRGSQDAEEEKEEGVS